MTDQTEERTIVLARSGLSLTDDYLSKKDKDGNVIAELTLQDIYSAKLEKRVDPTFMVWLMIGGGLGAAGYFLIENTILSTVFYEAPAFVVGKKLSNTRQSRLTNRRRGKATSVKEVARDGLLSS